MSFLRWEADTGRNRHPVAYLGPSVPTHVKSNIAIASVDAQPQRTVVFPSPQGMPSYRDRPTVAVGDSRSGHNMLTSERSIQSEQKLS